MNGLGGICLGTRRCRATGPRGIGKTESDTSVPQEYRAKNIPGILGPKEAETGADKMRKNAL